MANLEGLPLYEPIAVSEKRNHPLAGKLPKLLLGQEWVKYFGGQADRINTAPERLAHFRLTEQSASLPITALEIGDLSPGVWAISYQVRVTRPGTVSSAIQVTVHWTDDTVVQSESGANLVGNLTTTREGAVRVIRIDAATPISVSTTYATAGATDMQYALDVVAQRLAADAA